MYQPKDTKERIKHRLKITQGHLKKVLQMVEDDDYCIDIIHQSQAIQKALKEIDNLILKNHLDCCVLGNKVQKSKPELISEVMRVFEKKNLNG